MSKVFDLPPGWSQHEDPGSSKIYFYNQASGETSWTPPVASRGAAPKPPPKPSSETPATTSTPQVDVLPHPIIRQRSSLIHKKNRNVEHRYLVQLVIVRHGLRSWRRLSLLRCVHFKYTFKKKNRLTIKSVFQLSNAFQIFRKFLVEYNCAFTIFFFV